jgi:hypothetical protein
MKYLAPILIFLATFWPDFVYRLDKYRPSTRQETGTILREAIEMR